MEVSPQVSDLGISHGQVCGPHTRRILQVRDTYEISFKMLLMQLGYHICINYVM